MDLNFLFPKKTKKKTVEKNNKSKIEIKEKTSKKAKKKTVKKNNKSEIERKKESYKKNIAKAKKDLNSKDKKISNFAKARITRFENLLKGLK